MIVCDRTPICFLFFLNDIFVVYLPQTYITGHNLTDLILKRQKQIKQVRNMVESVDLCAFYLSIYLQFSNLFTSFGSNALPY